MAAACSRALRCDREAVLDLVGDVRSVQVAVLREELTVNVGDLRHEARKDAVRNGEVDLAPMRETSGGLLDALADEWVTSVEPRDSDAYVVERDTSVGRNPGASTSIIATQSATVFAIGPT